MLMGNGVSGNNVDVRALMNKIALKQDLCAQTISFIIHVCVSPKRFFHKVVG